MTTRRKKVKAWAIVNEKDSLHVTEYSGCFRRQYNVYALFTKRKDAFDSYDELYNNDGISLVPAVIVLSLPRKKPK